MDPTSRTHTWTAYSPLDPAGGVHATRFDGAYSRMTDPRPVAYSNWTRRYSSAPDPPPATASSVTGCPALARAASQCSPYTVGSPGATTNGSELRQSSYATAVPAVRAQTCSE